ncbi:unnamed protein product [Trichogramma brassicae]|uniref:Uncharacterized protein n=1 Tax=Trichogramma brassicae TaxID=86971 RepID=A0A6H5J0I1_9HYME|nr:unnamed protein product [Trichogramma brassicae]
MGDLNSDLSAPDVNEEGRDLEKLLEENSYYPVPFGPTHHEARLRVIPVTILELAAQCHLGSVVLTSVAAWGVVSSPCRLHLVSVILASGATLRVPRKLCDGFEYEFLNQTSYDNFVYIFVLARYSTHIQGRTGIEFFFGSFIRCGPGRERPTGISPKFPMASPAGFKK